MECGVAGSLAGDTISIIGLFSEINCFFFPSIETQFHFNECYIGVKDHVLAIAAIYHLIKIREKIHKTVIEQIFIIT